MNNKAFLCKGLPTIDTENHIATFMINTNNMDRDSEILYSLGADLKNYIGTPGHENPMVLWNHNQDLPIARTVKLTRSRHGLKAKIQFGNTAKAQEIFQLITDGILRTASVGYITKKVIEKGATGWKQMIDKLASEGYPVDRAAKRILSAWELLEFSVVSVPSNPNALIRRMTKGYKISHDMQKDLGVWTEEEVLEDTAMKNIEPLPEPLPEVEENINIEEEQEAVKIETVELPEEPKQSKPIVIELPQKKLNVIVYEEASTQPKSIEVLIVEEIQKRKGRV